MGISIAQPGASKAAAAAGAATGKASRAKEDRARAEREQARADQEAAQRQARQAAMDWDLQKMQITSQRAFERELRQEDYQLAAEDRAQAWQIEKAELTSRMDFEREEGERQRKLGVIDAKRAGIEKDITSGRSNREEYKLALFNLGEERRAIELGASIRAPLTELPGTGAAEQQAANRETRAQEAHAARMDEGPSMVDKRWAIKFLADNPKPWFFDDEETAEGRKIAREILGSEAPTVEDAVRTMGEVAVPPADIKYQQNRRTGQKRVSYDGGKTWQNL